MLAPLIIDPLIASLLLLLIGWISDLVGQSRRHEAEPRICRIPLHDSTILIEMASRAHRPSVTGT